MTSKNTAPIFLSFMISSVTFSKNFQGNFPTLALMASMESMGRRTMDSLPFLSKLIGRRTVGNCHTDS